MQNVFVLLSLALISILIYPLHHPKTNHLSGSTSFVASLKTLFGSTLTEVSLLNDFLIVAVFPFEFVMIDFV